MDALEHGKAILSAILPRNGDGGRRDLLEAALKRLTTGHFPDPQQRVIFQMLEQYLGAAGLVLPRSAVSDMLRSQPPGTALQYESYFDLLLATPPAPHGFTEHLDQLRDLAAERQTGETLAQAMEILQRGARQGRDWVQGHQAARDWALAQFGSIDRELRLQDAPEGDMRGEAQDILDDYALRARNQRTGYGVVKTGIPELDRATGGGVQPGEFIVVAADTNVGKSTMCAGWAWNACVLQGKNVVVLTSETNRTQYRLKLVARHSRHLAPLVAQIPGWEWVADQFPLGLDTLLLRQGALPGRGWEFLQAVLRHFADKPEHGRCWVAQLPSRPTVGVMEAKLARIARMFPVDLVVVDYLALFRSDRRREKRHEELSDIVQDTKDLAHSYQDGRGVPIITPWQMNRAGVDAARTRGFYVTNDLAATHESAATADAVFGLLLDGADTSHGRQVPVKLGVVKLRDGVKLAEPILLEADYATACFSPRGGTSPETVLDALGTFGGPPV